MKKVPGRPRLRQALDFSQLEIEGSGDRTEVLRDLVIQELYGEENAIQS